MPVRDDLGTRMKEFYEQVPKTRLTRRTPVAIRIDGKAFHTFTRGFDKPFDKVLGNAMVATMKYLCENIQGCVFGYTQSDEITLILIDYQKFTSSAWFDYEVQKMCSIAASMATMEFNRRFTDEIDKWGEENVPCWDLGGYDPDVVQIPEKTLRLCEAYGTAQLRGAMFDARCFNIPKEEVCNLVYWRQLDATRNSIQMVGQSMFSHNELQNKSCNQIQDMLMLERAINWNNFETRWKRGVAWRKDIGIDFEMPILRGEDRSYVEDVIFVGEI